MFWAESPLRLLKQTAYYSTDLYGPYGSVPSYISFLNTSATSIYTTLSDANALYLGIQYSTASGSLTSGGHALLADGINWDSTLDTGTLSLIDPLDPGANSTSTTGGYSNGIAISPVSTTGTLQLDPSNPNLLLLTYNQYEAGYYANGLPPSADYSTVHAVIGFSESVSTGAVPEPATWAMLAAGVGTLIAFRRHH